MPVQWFNCPSCGYSKQGCMQKIEVAPDYKDMKLLFLCEACKSVSTLKHPGLNGAILLIVGGPFVFAPTFYALMAIVSETLGLAQVLLAGLGAIVVTYLAVLLVGRLTQKYVLLGDRAA